jgi:hypothetical protein
LLTTICLLKSSRKFKFVNKKMINMKKKLYVPILLAVGVMSIQAKPVLPGIAKNLAINFYKQHSIKAPETVTLAYTETSTTGDALYYAFNINTNDGFVIVTADDAARPVIGYATERQFSVPEEHTTVGFWMKSRAKEIMAIKGAKLEATEDITKEWNGNFTAANPAGRLSQNVNTVTTTSVAPLIETTWNQPSPYNASCPGTGSNQAITGCVATAMAQIMKYWSYPTKGTSSSSYCDCTSSGDGTQYGTLSANYAATTYSWNVMPLNVSSPNPAVATLIYQCGVSVQMNYGPNESSSWMITADNSTACSQISYVKYFGYNSSSLQGLQMSKYSASAWSNLLENELNNNRPIQYVGDDATQGGHSWVCDGYDGSGNFHMNWGWSGADDGYFPLTNLTTGTGSYAFNPVKTQEALIGIEPPAGVDAGISAISSPVNLECALTFTPVVTIQCFGTSSFTTCAINYQLDGGATQSYTWTGSLVTGQTATVTLPAITTTAGTHTFTSNTSKPNNTSDANSGNDQSSVVFLSGAGTTGASLPLSQGFEGSLNLPVGWSVYAPNTNAGWGVTNKVSHSGTNCITIDNFNSQVNIKGDGYWFHTATYDFSGKSAATMSFAVAYATLTFSTTTLTDTLAVNYSTDCGTTWTQLYKKGGANLSTAPTDTSLMLPFSPTSSQWRVDVINLPAAVLGQSAVMFGFENISDWAESMYIDDINITSTNNTTGISSYNNEGIYIYPNPAHASLYISVTETTTAFSVTNVIGQTVIAEQRVDGSQQTQSIDISNLADGIYFMKVSFTDHQPQIIRFIKN